MSDFGQIIAQGLFDGCRCQGCGEKYTPHPDPATEEEAKLCPKYLKEFDNRKS